jgi:hypothetical protein
MNNDAEKKKLWPRLGAAILTTEDENTAGDAAGTGEEAGGEGQESTVTKEAAAAAETGEESKKGEEEGKGENQTGAPEAYADFTVPEGLQLDQELMGEFTPLAKEFNLPQEQAQKLIDLGSKMVQKTMDGIYAKHQEQVGNWLKQAEADPEIGADIKLGEKSAALRAFNTITGGDEKAKEMVNELGIGNHPEFLRIFYRVSQHMREDTFEIPGTGGQGGKSAAETLYPSMSKK